MSYPRTARHVRACRLFLTSCLLFAGLTGPAFSQTVHSTLQDVKPPSPEAISMVTQNFANVSLYTGKAGYSVPLYTLSENGISVPISISYSGSGGIKVEEMASSVGLGWSLQSTGVITRSVRGMADDAINLGYLNLGSFESTIFNISHPQWSFIHDNYRLGKYDAQPDIYFLNAPGISANFYISKAKTIVFVEKSDLKIDIIFNYYQQITGFTVTDLSGNKYLFDKIENSESSSITSPAPGWYNGVDAAAWYLSEIRDPNGSLIFEFEYAAPGYITTQLLRAPYQYVADYGSGTPEPYLENNTTYTQLEIVRPLLQTIRNASGEARFVMTAGKRCDLYEPALDSIIIENYLGEPIRSIHFNQSYFSTSGVTNGAGCATGASDHLRLKLDSVEIIGNDHLNKEVYKFTYNTSQLLPSRLTTFAMDHWGFYNGQTANTTWEAKHRELFYKQVTYPATPTKYLAEFGTANREPNATYAQACILKEVTTPLGGKLQFEYEGNTSNHPDLPNTINPPASIFSSAYTPDNQKQYFTIDMIREPFSFVRLNSPLASTSVKIDYEIVDSLETKTFASGTLESGSATHTHKLSNGVYYMKAWITAYSSDPSYFYTINLTHESETLLVNKPVGGVRIKNMKLVNSTGHVYTRNYYYNEEGSSNTSSPSTGVIARAPTYGHQLMDLFPNEYKPTDTTLWYPFAQGFVRQLSSAYPMVSSGGSYVGYSKVTTVDSDDLRSEFYYTTFSDFPQLADGYYDYTGINMNNQQYFDGRAELDGKEFEVHPFAPDDERDYFRGKLVKEIQFQKHEGSFRKISSTENTYIYNFGTAISRSPLGLRYSVGPEMVSAIAPEGLPVLPREVVEGVIFTPTGDCSCSRLKRYRLHTGKYDLHKTIKKSFTYSGSQVDSLTVEQTLDYGQAPWSRDDNYHYMVTRVTQQSSTGADTSQYFYPFDWRYANADIAVADTAFLRKLEKANRIGSPFLERKKNNDVHLATVKSLYNTFNTSQLYPSQVKIKGDVQATFEDRIVFNKYDVEGNILEQQKTNDQKLSYLWGYKNTQVIAEVVNASYDKIAYTSFEPDSKGNWTYSGSSTTDATAPTGSYSYSFTGNITRSGLGTGKFIVSYWKKSGTITVNTFSGTAGETINGWTYYEHMITDPASGLITVAGTGAVIDELRVYPAEAQMTTYTFKPLVGMTSSCDANNSTARYEYDSFGRLTAVRDKKNNIIKRTQYHLKGQ